ncbi:MAG: tryptophan--tRNA ligase [Candidatus Saccharimonadaceae bacterium]|nr:tryptophan--tRNA ligase [Candidatus Saccharimonadaceae bacterium]
MKTILTGIRSNSVLTLGNYLGALLPMVRLANKHSADYNINIFVPDLHSIISDIDGDLRENIVRTIKYYLAAGLEANDNVHIYRQSYVPAHSEMCWILNCIATMGETSRMIQYKEKSKGQESCNVGIFDYPILMAADILLYDATYVPIGEDQFQHIELTRNLAMRFNHKFGEIFTVPAKTADQIKFMGVSDGIRIRDLLNPEKKMSKSTKAANSKILLDDDPAKAAKKIMSATTDSLAKVKFDMFNQPGVSNLLQIRALVSGTPLQEVISEWVGETRYGTLKQAVADGVAQMLKEFQDRMATISDDQVYDLLEEGEKYANGVANAKLLEVQKAFHLR